MEDTIKEEIGERATFGVDSFVARWCGECGSKLVLMRRVIEGNALGAFGTNCPNPDCQMHINTPDNWREV